MAATSNSLNYDITSPIKIMGSGMTINGNVMANIIIYNENTSRTGSVTHGVDKTLIINGYIAKHVKIIGINTHIEVNNTVNPNAYIKTYEGNIKVVDATQCTLEAQFGTITAVRSAVASTLKTVEGRISPNKFIINCQIDENIPTFQRPEYYRRPAHAINIKGMDFAKKPSNSELKKQFDEFEGTPIIMNSSSDSSRTEIEKTMLELKISVDDFEKAYPMEKYHFYYCPISFELLSDPVIIASGDTFDRKTIEEHLKNSSVNPLTNLELENETLIPNGAIRDAIIKKCKNLANTFKSPLPDSNLISNNSALLRDITHAPGISSGNKLTPEKRYLQALNKTNSFLYSTGRLNTRHNICFYMYKNIKPDEYINNQLLRGSNYFKIINSKDIKIDTIEKISILPYSFHLEIGTRTGSSYISDELVDTLIDTKLTTLDITGGLNPEQLSKIARIISNNKYIETIKFYSNEFWHTYKNFKIPLNRDAGMRLLANAIANSKSVKTLSFSDTIFNENDYQYFIKILKESNSIETFELKSVNFFEPYYGDREIDLIIEAACSNPVIKEISISKFNQQFLSNEIINKIFNKQNLEHLGIPTSFNFVDNIDIMINYPKQLKSLDLSRCELTPRAVKLIADYISNNMVLEKLNLAYNSECKNEGAHYIAEAIRNNSALKNLSLTSCGITDDGVTELTKSLEVNTALTKLNLSENSLSIIGANAIADAIYKGFSPKLLSLMYVGSNKNKHEKYSSSPILQALTKCKTLEALYLSHTAFDIKNLKLIAEVLQRNVQLSKFFFFPIKTEKVTIYHELQIKQIIKHLRRNLTNKNYNRGIALYNNEAQKGRVINLSNFIFKHFVKNNYSDYDPISQSIVKGYNDAKVVNNHGRALQRTRAS